MTPVTEYFKELIYYKVISKKFINNTVLEEFI